MEAGIKNGSTMAVAGKFPIDAWPRADKPLSRD